MKMRVPLIVEVGHRNMSLDDVLTLGPGAIIEMNKHSDDSLDLLVNNKYIGTGEAVKVGENFGINVLTVGSPEDIVKAMGPSSE